MARTTRTPKIRLGELLVAAGLVTEDKVRMGLEEQRRNNLFLGEALVKLGFVSEEAIAQAIIQHFHLPFLSAAQFTVPPEVFNLFPERMYHEYQFIAVDKIERVIIIIAAGPINQDMMEELERVSECKICHYVSTWRDIYAAIQSNTKELGGEAQIELTGLGSMLLDNPNQSKSNATGTSMVQKTSTPSMIGAPRPSMFAKAPTGPSTKAIAAANMSAMLSPLAVSSKSTGASQVSSSTPPSPRLTAFLKVPPPSGMPSISSSGLSAIRDFNPPVTHNVHVDPQAEANMTAIFSPGSSSRLSAVSAAPMGLPPSAGKSNTGNVAVEGFPVSGGSSAGMPAVKKSLTSDGKEPAPPSKRMSSFLTIRKN
ncbi:MAG: hypothetical protein WCT04_05400 [Planctomycetota bacterium]